MKQHNSLLIIVLSFFLCLASAQAAVPRLINYQAKLTNTNGEPLEGAYDVIFRIYDAEEAGNLLWEEIRAGLVVEQGLFSTLLGSVAPLDLAFDKPYWLAIRVGSDSEMTPRQQIAASAYALRAEMAEDVVVLPRGMIVLWSGAISQIPQGWALCDGTNGTPDLTGRFIVHADSDKDGIYNVGNIGGENAHVLTEAEMPSHVHTINHGHDINQAAGGLFVKSGLVFKNSYISKVNRINVISKNPINKYSGNSGPAGSGAAHENRPPYYALAYIMKL